MRRFPRSKHLSLLYLGPPKAESSLYRLHRRHSPLGTYCHSERARQSCTSNGCYRHCFGVPHHCSVELHQRQDCRGLCLWRYVSALPPICYSPIFPLLRCLRRGYLFGSLTAFVYVITGTRRFWSFSSLGMMSRGVDVIVIDKLKVRMNREGSML